MLSGEMPEIGETITTTHALELCRHFGLDYLVKRIEANPEGYWEWKFDGCSGLPDRALGFLTGGDWRDITYGCCLPHDLCYAYGSSGDGAERKRTDRKFYTDLIVKAGMKKWLASVFYTAVRAGGAEGFGLSFSWAFARAGKSSSDPMR
jgi:hypothetical protein